MSLDERKEKEERCKIMFESELIYIYDIKIQICMTCIHKKEINKISYCNLQHDILNLYTRTKN